MKDKTIAALVSAVALVLTACICFTYLTFCTNVFDDTTVTDVDQSQSRLARDGTKVSTVTEKVRQEQKGTPPDNGDSGTTPDISPELPVYPTDVPPQQPDGVDPSVTPYDPEFITCAVNCHKYWGHSGLTYVYGGAGMTMSGEAVRTDCSGFVSYCLYKYGLLPDSGKRISSGGAWDSVPGVKLLSPKPASVNELQPGDLIVTNGHITIYAGNGKKVNWGKAEDTGDLYAACTKYSTDHLQECSINPLKNFSFSGVLKVYRVTGK